MLTPSACSYSLLLQEKTVFVRVSWITEFAKRRLLELRFDNLLVVGANSPTNTILRSSIWIKTRNRPESGLIASVESVSTTLHETTC